MKLLKNYDEWKKLYLKDMHYGNLLVLWFDSDGDNHLLNEDKTIRIGLYVINLECGMYFKNCLVVLKIVENDILLPIYNISEKKWYI